MFENFHGNAQVAGSLEQMIRQERIPQTLLLIGPEGVGKATLVRRFAARLLGNAEAVERDDLSLEPNQAIIGEREKWPSERRVEDPLLFNSHPDFVTFPPDGPLRQISIQQMRVLKERAQFKPLRGRWRVFLIDQLDRANEHAANSLLKVLEEPPDHLIVFLTAQNMYDLLPTIRSRSIMLHLTALAPEEMLAFALERGIAQTDRRLALACGLPGAALSLDLEAYDKRRAAMLALLDAASGQSDFSTWARYSEAIAASRTEKLDGYLKVLYVLLEDLLQLQHGAAARVRNRDLEARLEKLARAVSFPWLKKAAEKVDELHSLLRRNIQKGIALDALVLELRRATSSPRP